jgi:exopolyphosphatase/guanosine-5'-triphosphate,3'-diphosphate pyrophosphatase
MTSNFSYNYRKLRNETLVTIPFSSTLFMSPVASLDLGTNTFRLLIADVISRNRLSPLFTKRAITRLGEGFAQQGLIQPPAINRSMEVLEDFAKIIDHYQVEKVCAVATSVIREADNGEAFTHQIYERTGIEVRTLSGFEEAQLTLKGVLSAVEPRTTNALVFDIGGGSTEFILTEATRPLKTESIALGVVFLAETLLTSDLPTTQELSLLSTTIRKHLSLIDWPDTLRTSVPSENLPPFSLIGTAGTVTTLAAIDQKMEIYDPRTINNYHLSRDTLLNIYHRLTTVTAAQRTAVPGLEKGREVVIIPGTAIVLEIMNLFRCTHLIVSDAGLLEGILLDKQPFH